MALMLQMLSYIWDHINNFFNKAIASFTDSAKHCLNKVVVIKTTELNYI